LQFVAGFAKYGDGAKKRGGNRQSFQTFISKVTRMEYVTQRIIENNVTQGII
jgi:hypothetical protein